MSKCRVVPRCFERVEKGEKDKNEIEINILIPSIHTTSIPNYV